MQTIWHRLIQINAPFLAAKLREAADQVERVAPGPPALAMPILFEWKGTLTMGEITLKDDDAPATATVSYVDAKGAPTQPADNPVWSSSDDAVASVAAADDGRTATVSPGVPTGDGGSAAVIRVVAHDDDGEEIVSEGTVTVQPGDAVIGDITFSPGGAPTP